MTHGDGITSATLMPQDYVAATRSFYDRLQSLCAGTVGWPASLLNLQPLSPMIAEVSESWTMIYRHESRRLLTTALRDLGAPDDSPIAQQASNFYFYEKVLPRFISSFLFWIWEEQVPLTGSDQAGIVEAMLQGIIGYRLIDLHLDGETIGPEAVVLGNHLVRAHEGRLATIFGERTVGPILNKYAEEFARVEFLEKSHRGKPCPFSWEEPCQIGWKVAPLTAVLHLIMDRAGKSVCHIEAASIAMTRILAALQMMDDWQDAFSDLANGTETLAASGFHSWNKSSEISESRVLEFLDRSKMKRYVAGTLDLLNTAIQELEAAHEPILVFHGEWFKLRFLQQIVVGARQDSAA
jgi:hypothetical protein